VNEEDMVRVLPQDVAAAGRTHFERAQEAFWLILNAENLPLATRLSYAQEWEAMCHNENLDAFRRTLELKQKIKSFET